MVGRPQSQESLVFAKQLRQHFTTADAEVQQVAKFSGCWLKKENLARGEVTHPA